MNAAEQALGLVGATKIAAVANLFKAQFPDAKSNLRPWHSDPRTQELVDPDSIDLAFHLPGWSPRYQCHSMLLQIRFYTDPDTDSRRVIGIEAIGMGYSGQTWRLSTIASWTFTGEKQPATDVKQRLKTVCRQILELFDMPLAA